MLFHLFIFHTYRLLDFEATGNVLLSIQIFLIAKC